MLYRLRRPTGGDPSGSCISTVASDRSISISFVKSASSGEHPSADTEAKCTMGSVSLVNSSPVLLKAAIYQAVSHDSVPMWVKATDNLSMDPQHSARIYSHNPAVRSDPKRSVQICIVVSNHRSEVLLPLLGKQDYSSQC